MRCTRRRALLAIAAILASLAGCVDFTLVPGEGRAPVSAPGKTEAPAAKPEQPATAPVKAAMQNTE